MAGLTTKQQKLIVDALNNPGQLRQLKAESQTAFWHRFGLGQTAGSRYEIANRNMSPPVAMLFALYAIGYISDDDCAEVLAVFEAWRQGQPVSSNLACKHQQATGK